MLSATVMPAQPLPSSQASFHVLPLGLHSVIQVGLSVGSGESGRLAYMCPVCVATYRSATGSASIAALYGAWCCQPKESQQTSFVPMPLRFSVGPSTLIMSTACSGVKRIEAYDAVQSGSLVKPSSVMRMPSCR